ncbi:phage portal protein family protein [Streptomyces cinereoruber]|uniref:phage portal protein family protein n=1 Tax=Streptomyces cinereoruber TaxID=67260 RepID=UPI0036293459
MASGKKPKKIGIGEIGNSGVSLVSGHIIGEEYNRKLQGWAAMRIWDEMRRSDGTVSMVLAAMNAPIIGADWFIEKASDDTKDVEVAEYVEENLMNQVKLKRKLPEILTMLPFGFSLFEKVYAAQLVKGKMRIALSDLAFRKQTTINAWETRDHEPGITQQTIKGIFDIPEANLARFTRQQEGDNYEGISVLRGAYKHWYIKDKLYKIAAIGHERQAVGVPFAAYQTSATKEQKAELEKYLRNLRTNQESFMLFPVGTEVGFMDMKGGTTTNTKDDVLHHDRQIAKNSLLQFMDDGSQGASGSRALSEDHSRMFVQAIEALADYIAEIINESIIKQMVDLNFNVTEYPKLSHGKLGDENIPVISEAIGKLVTAGAIELTPEDENRTRKLLGYRELTEEEIEQRVAAGQQEEDDDQADDLDDGKATDKLATEARKTHAKLTRKLYGHTGSAA